MAWHRQQREQARRHRDSELRELVRGARQAIEALEQRRTDPA
jgi:hypothetical protein